MSTADRMNVGIVGSGGRGRSFRAGLEVHGASVHAVCDTDKDRLDASAAALEAKETYTDYDEMLERSDIQAVVIGTPMNLHVPQAIAALKRNLHVLSEVPAGVSVDECRELVAACGDSQGVYMMAENYIYMRANIIVRELARQGLFGEVYYAEGEYIHEVKGLNEKTKWRRKWQTGINGITYGTHSLGPILQWLQGDRVTRVCCEGSGHRHRDPRGDLYENEASCVMLCKTERDALLKIRVDMLSDRPHSMTNYQLQGTDGAYESRRAPDERGRLWLRDLCEKRTWFDIEDIANLRHLAETYMPEMWRNPPAEALRAGHGGGDYFEMGDWFQAIRGEKPCPLGIHAAMDMTLPGLVSQQSILEDGTWLDVPDSRDW
jgi:predicted dehydrogenase